MNRLLFAALCAALAALSAALCGAVALAAPDVPPPPQQRPWLVQATATQSLWWYEDLPGAPCPDPAALTGFEARAGSLTQACVDGPGAGARYTLLVDGEARLVLWRGAVLEDTRYRLSLPLIQGANQ